MKLDDQRQPFSFKFSVVGLSIRGQNPVDKKITILPEFKFELWHFLVIKWGSMLYRRALVVIKMSVNCIA